MTQEKIDRINELARKKKSVGLTEEELQEQADNNSSDITSLQTQMGDVETALDNIIEIQNTLIGGDAE